MKKITESRMYIKANIVVFVVTFCCALFAMMTLCYRQAMSDSVQWPSDIGAYIEEMLGVNTEFDFPYPIMFKTAKFINYFVASPEWAMVIAVTLFNAIAILLVKTIFEKQTGTKILSTIATFCLFFLSMIYGRIFNMLGMHGRYIGVMSPNPWHNHTYMAARPFMIVAFAMGASILNTYENELSPRNAITKNVIYKYTLFSIVMLLVTMTKPSYTTVHMAVAGLVIADLRIYGKCLY